MIFGLDIFVIVFIWELNGGSMPSIEFDHMSDVFVWLVIWHSSLTLSVLCFDGLFWNFTFFFFFKYGKFGMICSICCHLSYITLGWMFKIYKEKLISVYWILLTCPFFDLTSFKPLLVVFFFNSFYDFTKHYLTILNSSLILPSTIFPCWLMPD